VGWPAHQASIGAQNGGYLKSSLSTPSLTRMSMAGALGSHAQTVAAGEPDRGYHVRYRQRHQTIRPPVRAAKDSIA